jgi:hypothetical protein
VFAGEAITTVVTWTEVDLVGDPDKDIPPWIAVWRSVREGGDTKTKRSRRSLALPEPCVEALKLHQEQQRKDKKGSRREVEGSWARLRLEWSARRSTPTTPTTPDERPTRSSRTEDTARLVSHSGTAVGRDNYCDHRSELPWAGAGLGLDARSVGQEPSRRRGARGDRQRRRAVERPETRPAP